MLEDTKMAIDFGRTAADYGRYRVGFPDSFFERLFANGIARAGARILDVGTGTGAVARGLALRGCDVTGLDPSQNLLDEAKRLDKTAQVSVRYVLGRAENTSLPAASFDTVTAGQCWHWFDRAAAAREILRVLKPGGALVIAHFDWLPLAGNVVEATEHLILTHNPEWNGAGNTGLYPRWLADVALGGFEKIETFSFDVTVLYSHEAWRGRIRASAGVAASLPSERVKTFDLELAALLAARFPADPLSVPHRVWAVTAHAPL